MFAVSGTAVGIVTRYCIDDPRKQLVWGKNFPQSSSPAAELYHTAVHYNCSNTQHKRIPAAVQPGSRSISQLSALQLQ